MVGAKHIIQRQFIRGYDEDDSDPRMYLMEFMLVEYLNSLVTLSWFSIIDDQTNYQTNCKVLGGMELSISFYERFLRIKRKYS